MPWLLRDSYFVGHSSRAESLLNFLKGYDLRRRMDKLKRRVPDELRQALAGSRRHLLRRLMINNYRAIDPANSRMRALMSDTLDRGLWKVLWYLFVPRKRASRSR